MKNSLAILFLLLATPTLFSQDLASRQINGLLDVDFFDAFSVGDTVYIYRTSGLPALKNAVNDLTKLITVDRAALHGVPGKIDCELMDVMLELKTRTSLHSVAAEIFGNSGFLWKVVHEIGPAHIGSTGVWPKFVSYVNPDGSLIKPEKYICSGKLVAEDTHLFSVISFDDLSMISDGPEIDGEDALRIGRESIEKLCTEALKQNIVIRTRYHDQRLVGIPIKTKNAGETNYRQMWRVRFILADHVSYELLDSDPVVVWITTDGCASTLSINEWHAKNRRTKD